MAVDERSELEEALSRWQLDAAAGRERMYRAPTPRERERWHAPGAGAAGLVHRAGGHGAGARPAHGRQLAGRFSPGRSRRAGLCAHGWVPPALNAAQ
jgi:hypothetical protein